jgi:PKD domain-containing protein
VTDQARDRLEKRISNPDDLSAEEIEARLGVPASGSPAAVRRPLGAPTEPAHYVTTRRRILWRDSATILLGVVLALLAVRFVLPSGPAAAVGSPSPEDTSLVAVASLTLSPMPTDTPAPTLGNVVPPSLHLDATPTPIPVITLPPATPRPQPTPTPRPGLTPGPTAPGKTPPPTPKPTPKPTPSPAPVVVLGCSVPAASMMVTCGSAGSLYTKGATYTWTFGDGATSHAVGSASHLYAVPGSYTVRLTITNATGSGHDEATVSVPGT